MRKLRDVLCGAIAALGVAVLVPNLLSARQQVPQPGVVPGPADVRVVGPAPLPIGGTVAAQQGGAWTVAAQQAGTWSVRLAEPAPVATPAFIRQGACYVLLADTSGGASPVYRVGAAGNGWIQIQPVRMTPGTLPPGWINLSRLTFAAESPCPEKP